MVAALLCCFVLLGQFTPNANAAGRPATRIYDEYGMPLGLLEEGKVLAVAEQTGSFYPIAFGGQWYYIPAHQVALGSDGRYYVNCKEASGESVLVESRSVLEAEMLRTQIVDLALDQLGTPYVYGGSQPGGFDCSGLLYYTYNAMGISIPRTGFAQLEAGLMVSREDMRPGDLVFFRDTDGSDDYITHVGMYLGGGLFCHAGSSGVCIRSLADDYYRTRFVCARRFLLPGPFTMPQRRCIALN